jgi:hypothetical protein
MVFATVLASCGNEGGAGGQLESQSSQAEDSTEAEGPSILYVNTTGYSNSLMLGWEPVPGANMYGLTKTVGRNVQVIWVEGTEFVDAELPSGEQPKYSLMINTVTGGLGPSGRTLSARNNRTIVDAMNAKLRLAASMAEVRRILDEQMALHFDQIFVGEDSDGLSFNDRAMLFAFFVAHNYVPYGNSNKFELMALLQEQVLDCDNYSVLAGLMFHLITDRTRMNSLEFIGFDGGPIGNHAQLIYTPDAGGEVWLVDSTVGLIATFDSADELLTGGKAHRMSNYYAYFDNNVQPVDIPPWIVRIKNALTQGGYRQDQVIYRYPTLSAYMTGW